MAADDDVNHAAAACVRGVEWRVSGVEKNERRFPYPRDETLATIHGSARSVG